VSELPTLRHLERGLVTAYRRRPVSRRYFLRRAGAAAGVLSVPAILNACGIAAQSPTPGPTASPAPTATATGPAPTATASPSPTAVPSPVGQLSFANWPLYIDIDEDTSGYPSLEKFTSETGINVTYAEDINDNEEFFGRIQPDLAAGRAPGYDLIVMTDWMIERMIRLGYLQELDKSRLPNHEANVQALYRDPWYDPGNRYSIAYQSGITGIGYNPTLTGREITNFDDLLDPAFRGRVGMFSEMRDTMSLCLLSLGIRPQDATVADVERAQQKLLAAAEAGQFRAFYGNDYYEALAAGNLAVTIAWSGDVSQMKLYDNEDVEFVVPEEGGMLWVDNMAIPNPANAPVDAHLMMDFWYDLDNAVALTEYIGYFSPVTGVADRVREDAQAARDEGDDEWADALEVIAQTAFPDNEQLANVHNYKLLDEAEERIWNDLFNEVVAG
jgi:spermidine/putrescine transport system substrate-binding protein